MSEREYWANVAKRPGMFLGRTTLTGLEGFLIGYDQHAQRHGGPGLDGWQEWLAVRRGGGYNLGWPAIVRNIALPDGADHWHLLPAEEEQVIQVLFELLDEFLAEREVAPNAD